ncbi:CPBP family intramembrane glutamic endopeptidase [Desertihabitans aurantiacus]|uniref:CPBP family intramembrane glutamic endopeptidase n=1 Tax=Desertihabitans aurantiacus TaxID=2282477 RepID=UPI000DF7AA2B|nr:CPBP family intramembrane glutamic endopeptidase [Desertihabitans aurantiacus]
MSAASEATETAADSRSREHESYVEAARRGRHRWWHYLLGLALVLFAWMVVANVASALVAFALGGEEGVAAFGRVDFAALGPVGGFLVLMAGWPVTLGAVLIAVGLIHRRHPRTLVTAAARISWRRIVHGFVAWLLPFLLVIGLVQYLVYPDTFTLNTDVATFALFVPVALVLTAIQTTTEELFFRGYLVQTASLVWTNRIFLALVSAVVFTLPHVGNPEAAGGWLSIFLNYFFGMGLIWAVVSLVDGTTELAIGAHFANNIANFVLISASGTVVTTPGLVGVSEYHALFYDLSNLVSVPVFLAVVYGLFKKGAPPRASWGHRAGGR